MHKPGPLGKGKRSFSYSRSRTTVHQLLLSFLHLIQDVCPEELVAVSATKPDFFLPQPLGTRVVFRHLGCSVVSLSRSVQSKFETDLGGAERKINT